MGVSCECLYLRSYVYDCNNVTGRTQVRRGPPDTSPQQTGTSRTVKRYPSSSGPITSNALPSGNSYNSRGSEQRNWNGHRSGQNTMHSFNGHRPSSDNQLNSALYPAGKNTCHLSLHPKSKHYPRSS